MSSKERRPYCKPEMERVRLVPDEAVLGGCKTNSGGGIGTETAACSVGAISACVSDTTS